MRFSISDRYIQKKTTEELISSVIAGFFLCVLFVLFGLNIDWLTKNFLILICSITVSYMFLQGVHDRKALTHDLKNRFLELRKDRVLLVDHNTEVNVPIKLIQSITIQVNKERVRSIHVSIKSSSTFMVKDHFKIEGYCGLEKIAEYFYEVLPEENISVARHMHI